MRRIWITDNAYEMLKHIALGGGKTWEHLHSADGMVQIQVSDDVFFRLMEKHVEGESLSESIQRLVGRGRET